MKRLFPQARSYLDVYDHYGLVRERAVYAHCIHLEHTERVRMAQAGAWAAFCPSSNLHLSSGLFDLAATDAAGLRFSMARHLERVRENLRLEEPLEKRVDLRAAFFNTRREL